MLQAPFHYWIGLVLLLSGENTENVHCFLWRISQMRSGINQWQSTHNHICVDSDFTLALAFALCALRAFSNAFERNSAPVGKAAQLLKS
jgi:hypothetical protein